MSKGACLSRFDALFDTVVDFFQTRDLERVEMLVKMKNAVAYLSDIYVLLNESNKKLQGNMMTMVTCKSVIRSSVTKLGMFRSNVGRGELTQFPHLSENDVSIFERAKYCSHLENLRDDMT